MRQSVMRGPRKLGFASALWLVLGLLQVPWSTPATAATGAIDLIVRDAACLEAGPADPSTCDIPAFRWMINVDNTHDDASITPPASYSPIALLADGSPAVGDESNATGIVLPEPTWPDRGYLVSVFVNDGTSDLATRYPVDYKLGGAHFTIPDADGEVVVELRPNPLPLSTLRVRVFHDNQLVNAEDDIPVEDGLGGFHVTLSDRVGEVTTDWFGNPLCTRYQDLDGDGTFDVPGDLNAEGDPVPIPGTGGFCRTDGDGFDADGDGYADFVDADGDHVQDPGEGPDPDGVPEGWVVIPNLGPDRYEVEAIPPDGTNWIQTTTIEGTLHIDAWIEEGHDGFSTEEGFTQAAVWIGFVRPCSFGNTSDDCTSPTADAAGRSGRITGRVRSIALDDESGLLRMGNPVVRPWLALNNIGGNDEQVYTGRGNPDGTFVIPNVPAGLYQLVIWDAPLDHIIQFQTVRVPKDNCGANLRPCTVDLGDIGVPPWFGRITGYDYLDTGVAVDGHVFPDGAGNGIRDCYDDGDDDDGDGVANEIEPGDLESCERGLQGQDNDTRFKDGTIQYATFADRNGRYEFPEVFELEHFAIAEVGYGRYKQTGATGYETDEFGEPVGYPYDGIVNRDEGLASLLQSEITWAGTTNHIDWGKAPFDTSGCKTSDPSDPCENGGIVGIAFYAVTRNELDAALQAAEDYEPGIPGVRFNLYAAALDENGEPRFDPDTGEVVKDHLAAVYDADSWYDSLPTDCVPRGSVGRTADQVEPNGDPPGEPSIFADCIELPALLQQIRSGVFDGGYAFDADCSPDLADRSGDEDGDGVANRFDEDLLLDYEAGDCRPLPSGAWVVEVVPPPGYQVVREEDVNVFGGDQFVPAVPPPPCAGPLHQVDVMGVGPDGDEDGIPSEPVYNPDFASAPSVLSPFGFGSPYEGEMMPLCTERLIDLKNGTSVNADFFLFSDVPQPGRIRGVLLDDLTLELDPGSPLYAEKRGIPNAPIGIRDYTGKLITTVYSDENGYWEVLLPSTGTYNCPLPAGPCPAVYQVIGNDPGTPEHPNPGWNPNYGTLKLSFDVWPGLTTYADVAILPITGFVQRPGPQFEPPVQCEVPAGTPDLQEVSSPVVRVGDLPEEIVVQGSGFAGATATLDGVDVPTVVNAATELVATIPEGTAPGPHQLLVRKSGETSPTGITVHVLGPGYDPPLVHVDAAAGSDATGDGSAGAPYATIQRGIDEAAAGSLILVHPGAYLESLLVDREVKLQGFGPGATTIDGRFFNFGGISAGDFAAKIAETAYDGPETVPMGQVITVLAEDGEFGTGPGDAFVAQIDGFAIRGGTRVRGNVAAPSQGGGVYAHAFARGLTISNDLIQSNAGNLGGAIVLGQPYLTNPDAGDRRDSENDDVRIHHDRIVNNGGVSLAGAIGIFNGANGTEIDHNVICGNYAAEYGGGISAYGKSSGRIHDNRITYNFAFDEGGGVMIAGEEPPDPATQVSAGSGDWLIERNLIQGNVSNDDGGGIRLLTPVDGRVRIASNLIVDNLATDAGGGISLDDALRVEIVNNTIARNVSTATAEDADRTSCAPAENATCPHGAGLVSEMHSAGLIAARGLRADSFSDPVLFNNIFWKNEAFYLDGNQVVAGYTEPSAGYIDLEVLDLNGNPNDRVFTSRYGICTLSTDPNCTPDNHNIYADPGFLQEVSLDFDVLAFGGDPTFITVIVRSKPSDPQGDYHVGAGSPAVDAGTASSDGVSAPCDDVDGDPRPSAAGFDIGADEQPGGSDACAAPPPPPEPESLRLAFSTLNDVAIPGVAGPYDDADVYGWTGSGFTRILDASEVGLAAGADVDGLLVVDADTAYLSFAGNAGTNVPGVGSVQDEDVVLYDAGVWSLVFDGSDVGLGETNAEDVDAFEVLGDGSIVVSTFGTPDLPDLAGEARQDLFRCQGGLGADTTCTWSFYLDASDVGLTQGGENVDGAAVGTDGIYLSVTESFSVAGLSGADEDVFLCSGPVTGEASSCRVFALFFDGSANGIADDLDAVDLP